MPSHQKTPAIVIEIRRRAEEVVQKNRRKVTAKLACHTPVKVHGLLPRIPLPPVEVDPFPPPARVATGTTSALPSG
jgi:hypothetical protein